MPLEGERETICSGGNAQETANGTDALTLDGDETERMSLRFEVDGFVPTGSVTVSETVALPPFARLTEADFPELLHLYATVVA